MTQEGDETACHEKEHVQHEDHNGQPVQPCSVVGQTVQQHGHDAGAHGDREPSGTG